MMLLEIIVPEGVTLPRPVEVLGASVASAESAIARLPAPPEVG